MKCEARWLEGTPVPRWVIALSGGRGTLDAGYYSDARTPILSGAEIKAMVYALNNPLVMESVIHDHQDEYVVE